MTNTLQPVLNHLAARQPQIEAWLKTFLRIPSVSADPAYAASMDEARRFLCERLRAEGLQQVQLLDGGGEAAVYAEWTGAPGRPTVLIYGHYDVQPADPVALWRTPPFEPTQVGDRLYARGTSDVKGSTTIALEVVFAFLATLRACPVNIKVFIEGEEETGSPSLRPLIDRYRDLLAADAVLSADGGRASATTPTINTGARGSAALEVKLRTASKDLHSGRYGGGVRNAPARNGGAVGVAARGRRQRRRRRFPCGRRTPYAAAAPGHGGLPLRRSRVLHRRGGRLARRNRATAPVNGSRCARRWT